MRPRQAGSPLDIGSIRMHYSYMKKRSTKNPARTRAVATDDVMYSLMHAAGTVERRLEEALGQAGLSMPKFAALTHLVRAGESLSLGECAAKMTCVRSNVTQLVDRLEADGLVRRVDDPGDRRGVKAVVTPLGVERQAAGARLVEQVQKEFAKSLSGVDRAALARALDAIV
ncbi:MAG: MarR family transcriptional regulator [Betaproteobacteria bacterium]|nr:MAG: MarR family transcriptional regulator [Betaproteobacteria bacterium]